MSNWRYARRGCRAAACAQALCVLKNGAAVKEELAKRDLNVRGVTVCSVGSPPAQPPSS